MKSHFRTVPVETAARAGSPELEPRQPLVLVVDDEVLIQQTQVSILNGHGLATMTAMDAGTALELARLAPPDVLLTDVKLPGTDGFALALEVSKAARNCDIVLLSGELSTLDRAAEYRAQGLDFVLMIKPVHPTELLACVFELLSLRGWLIPDKIPPRNANPSDLLMVRSVSSAHRKTGIGP